MRRADLSQSELTRDDAILLPLHAQLSEGDRTWGAEALTAELERG